MNDFDYDALQKKRVACVAEGYISWADIRQMLKEYDVTTELV